MHQSVSAVMAAIAYIEGHLDEALTLNAMAAAANSSKFHLHRLFSKTVGITMHDYLKRRQLTEAARLLVFSGMPILDIALFSGYESQQAFSSVFKELYKKPPNQYRREGLFYPLQLRFHPLESARGGDTARMPARSIVHAALDDIPRWMELVRTVVDGFPHLDETEYVNRLKEGIGQRSAFIMKEGGDAIGAMITRPKAGSIDFLAVHPQCRSWGVERAFLGRVAGDCHARAEISITTFREGDKADTGHREAVKSLGFTEAELLVEHDYPTQRFIMRRDEAAACRA